MTPVVDRPQEGSVSAAQEHAHVARFEIGGGEIGPAIATHFVRGGDGRRALPHLAAAARQASERLAAAEAIEIADTALALLPGLAEDEERLGWELRAIVAGGRRIVERLRAGGCDPIAARPSLGWRDAPALLV